MTSGPSPALVRWVASIPTVRCIAPAIRPWTNARDSKVVPITKSSRFGNRASFGAAPGLRAVGHGRNGYNYLIARAPSQHAIVLRAVSDEGEDSFTAVLGEASNPPAGLATLTSAPRTGDGLGLGSTRVQVERVLGPAHPALLCGYQVVRYEPAQPVISESEIWFVYRDGKVVAISRYDAV